MARLLVIDQEADCTGSLVAELERSGHEVRVAEGGRHGLELAGERAPDLVLLELQLPDMGGYEVCRTLKQNPGTRDVPIVVLTHLSSEIDRVVAFELGAEDYVVKPFSIREMVLRVRSVLRRRQDQEPPEAELSCGGLRLDRLARSAWIEGKEVSLSSREFKVLQTLCTMKRRVCSRRDLVESVWGNGASVSDRSVDVYVKRVRRKLGDAGHCIETVRGVGYRLTPLKLR